MITIKFNNTDQPCTNCPGFCDISGCSPHCLLRYAIYFKISYFPVSPCNRPLDADALLDLMNSLFLRDN